MLDVVRWTGNLACRCHLNCNHCAHYTDWSRLYNLRLIRKRWPSAPITLNDLNKFTLPQKSTTKWAIKSKFLLFLLLLLSSTLICWSLVTSTHSHLKHDSRWLLIIIVSSLQISSRSVHLFPLLGRGVHVGRSAAAVQRRRLRSVRQLAGRKRSLRRGSKGLSQSRQTRSSGQSSRTTHSQRGQRVPIRRCGCVLKKGEWKRKGIRFRKYRIGIDFDD